MLYCRRCGEPYLRSAETTHCHNCKNLLVLTAEIPVSGVKLNMKDSFLPLSGGRSRITLELPKVTPAGVDRT